MCTVWEREDPQTVPLERLRQLLADPAIRESLEVVNFTGGEPFLRSDLPELAAAFAAACPRLRELGIPTNASMPSRIAGEVERLAAALPSRVRLVLIVSVDGAATTHDRVRGVPGLHERVLATLRLLSGIRERQPRLSLGLNMTVMPANAHDIDDVLALGEAHGIGVTLTPAVRSDLYIDSASASEWNGTSAEWQGVAGALRRAAHRSGTETLLDACRVIDGGERRSPCVFWTRGAFLDADGGLYVCPVSRDGYIASIHTPGDVAAAWRSDAHVAALRRLRSGACRTCVSNCMATEAEHEDVIDAVRRAGRPVVIFGAGAGGRKARAALGGAGISIASFVDNAAHLHNQLVDDLPVVPFDADGVCRGALTVIATMTGAGQVAAQLESAGLVEGRDFVRYF
jgi:MoaA/NifB/PqqE/SkfB family radical SAM enzyme